MMLVNQTPGTSAELTITATSFPNLYVGVSGTGQVAVERKCADNVWRSYPDTTFATAGARVLSVPAGQYRLVVTEGTLTIEAQQL